MDKPGQSTDIRTSLVKMLSEVEQATALTTDDLNAINEHLNTLYAMSGENEEVGAFCTQIAQSAQSLVEVSNANLFKAVSLGSIATAALEEAEGEKQARIELEDAIDTGNEEHPRLKDFAEEIRAEVAGDFEVDWEQALESNYDQVRNDIIRRIQSLTYFRVDPYVATQFVDVVLLGVGAPNELQREMLAELVASFADVQRVRHGA